MNKQEILDKQRAIKSLSARPSSDLDKAINSIHLNIIDAFVNMYETIEKEVNHKLIQLEGKLISAQMVLEFYASEDNHKTGQVSQDLGAKARAELKK